MGPDQEGMWIYNKQGQKLTTRTKVKVVIRSEGFN